MPLKEAEAGLTRIVESSLVRLAERVAKALEVPVTPMEHSLRIMEPGVPDVDVSRIFDTPWDILWFLIPMTLFRSLIRRHFVRRINWEVEKHLARTAAQWAERINKTIECAAKEEESYVQEQLSTFQAMLSETDSRIPTIRQALDELHASRKAIEEWVCDESNEEAT